MVDWTDIEYDHCINCGYFPAHLTFDLTQEVAFNTSTDATKYDSITAHALNPKTENPFPFKANISDGSPWLGKKLRIGKMVINSEYQKGKGI